MSYESQLLKQFQKMCWNVESFAIDNIHNIQMPICGILSELTSTDCLNLIKYELDNRSCLSQPNIEKILLNYLISDYISCGLSSPVYHSVFNKSLQSDKSKMKLLKDLVALWDYLFKNYEITSQNIEFVRNFAFSLENLFNRISNSAPDFGIKYLSNKVLDRIKFNIRTYEQNLLNGQIFHSFHHISNNDLQLHDSNENRLSDIGNIVLANEQKIKLSIQHLVQQGKKKRENEENRVENKNSVMNNEHQNRNIDMFGINHINNREPSDDGHLSKKSNYIPIDAQNLLNESSKSDLEVSIVDQQLPQQKLNVFQVMMLNAKKRKMNKSK